MKPIGTYTVMLGLAFAAAWIHTIHGGVPITSFLANGAALMSLQGHVRFYPPQWHEEARIEFPFPRTSQLIPWMLMAEAGTLAIACAGHTTTAGWIRAIAACLQIAAVGKISRDEREAIEALDGKKLTKANK